MKKSANRKLRHKLAHPRHKNCSDHFFMAIFVFSTKKPMGIAASMNEKLRNVALVGGLLDIILPTTAFAAIAPSYDHHY